jgi:RNA polymerase sigma-70 factor (ECF subfamily)
LVRQRRGGRFTDVDSADAEKAVLKRAVGQRDPEAIASLYIKYYSQIKRHIASLISSVADVEDLAQDVFVELCRGNGRYNGHTSAATYLFGVATNVVRHHNRRRRCSIRTISIHTIGEACLCDDADDAIDRDTVREISAQQLKRVTEDLETRLPPKAREAVRLRFIDGLNAEEAAEEAGCSIHTFSQRTCDGMKTLRRLGERHESEL